MNGLRAGSLGLLVFLATLGVTSAGRAEPAGAELLDAGQSQVLAEATDLFQDVPGYPDGYVRLAAWNVRHLKVRGESVGYFRGRGGEADAAAQLATFAKAILDLRLDLVVLVEVQPRVGEPDRLAQLVEILNQVTTRGARDRPIRAVSSSLHTGPWRSAQTHLEYDDVEDPHGNLQFGLLWNTARHVCIDSEECQVLEELRQPQGGDLGLLRREQRAPWLIPVRVRHQDMWLEFDLLALHLKSGGTTPQAAEVDAVSRFIRGHRAATGARHLIVCGDWNIRPDEESQGRGRARLRKLCCPTGNTSLLRLLTVGDIRPTLAEWETLETRIGGLDQFSPLFRLLPRSHLAANDTEFDSLLDHMAISRSLEEVFDHPVRVVDAASRVDFLPGIEIPPPQVSREEYLHFTDHLPVVLTLRVCGEGSEITGNGVRLAAILPNPVGDEEEAECVTLHNVGTKQIPLAGWRLQNARRETWELDMRDAPSGDGVLERGGRITIYRRGRPMRMSNSGDTLALFDSQGQLVDVWIFGSTGTGERLQRDP